MTVYTQRKEVCTSKGRQRLKPRKEIELGDAGNLWTAE